jgi:hypothetical protein
MPREIEVLQLPEHRGAHVVLDVERDASAAIPAVVGEHEHQQAEDDHQRQPGREWPVVLDDDVVDDHRLHEGEHRLDELAADRDAERDVGVLLVRLHVTDEAPDPTLFLLGLLVGFRVGLLAHARARAARRRV